MPKHVRDLTWLYATLRSVPALKAWATPTTEKNMAVVAGGWTCPRARGGDSRAERGGDCNRAKRSLEAQGWGSLAGALRRGAQVAVFEQAHQIRLGRLLQRQDCQALDAHIVRDGLLLAGHNLPHQALERRHADEQPRAFLVLAAARGCGL
jgi:hypothetical protein